MTIQSESNGHHLTFLDDKKRHVYILDGEKIPSVTTICKGGFPTSEALVSWMQGQAADYALTAGIHLCGKLITQEERREIIKEAKAESKKKAEEAAAIGTLVHDYAYNLEIYGTIPTTLAETIKLHPDKDKIEAGINAFLQWYKENGDEMVLSESIVASVIHQFAGKFDRLARRRGLLVLSDFKTSNSIYLDQYIQLGAYSILIREWLGLEVQGFEILRFGKDGEFQTLMVSDPSEIRDFEEQAIRCRQTYGFRKYENDPRWKYYGSSEEAKGKKAKSAVL